MTEKEAIEIIRNEKQCLEKASKGACDINCGECKYSVMITKEIDSCDIVIKALEEIQQYRAIGTVEECREAREKQKPKKPLGGVDINGNEYKICRECSAIVEDGEWRADYCPDCGCKID